MSDRFVRVCVSRDGGYTYGNWRTKSLGELGEYQDRTRVRFLRLGMAHNLRFKVESSSPIATHILDFVAQVDGAAS